MGKIQISPESKEFQPKNALGYCSGADVPDAVAAHGALSEASSCRRLHRLLRKQSPTPAAVSSFNLFRATASATALFFLFQCAVYGIAVSCSP
ncbi:hypothetical protein Nepgr_011050 [Nepenthes gracilis]|uniref:Uncharacterized protein n=1 Tax=Nepenthes gracilis TaxID=150966 RepID=A0AAD3XLX8_NEPGR|nr:hypothetical protein Nepgr_011050 [Nepenthes gracilis]